MKLSLPGPLLIGAGVAAGAVVLLYLATIAGKSGGDRAGKGLGNFAGGLAVGLVKGAGEAIAGLPDPSDPDTERAGQQALARGDYLEASKKLAAGDFLAGVAGNLREWWSGDAARIVALQEGAPRDLTAGAGSITNGKEGVYL